MDREAFHHLTLLLVGGKSLYFASHLYEVKARVPKFLLEMNVKHVLLETVRLLRKVFQNDWSAKILGFELDIKVKDLI